MKRVNKHEFYIMLYLSMVFLLSSLVSFGAQLFYSKTTPEGPFSLRYSSLFNLTQETQLNQIYFLSH